MGRIEYKSLVMQRAKGQLKKSVLGRIRTYDLVGPELTMCLRALQISHAPQFIQRHEMIERCSALPMAYCN